MDGEKMVENIIDRVEKKRELEKKSQELSKEQIEKLGRVCRSIFSSSDGQFLARAMMKYSGIYKMNKNNNNLYEIGKERGKEQFYLFFIVSMLPEDIRMQIERNNDIK